MESVPTLTIFFSGQPRTPLPPYLSKFSMFSVNLCFSVFLVEIMIIFELIQLCSLYPTTAPLRIYRLTAGTCPIFWYKVEVHAVDMELMVNP